MALLNFVKRIQDVMRNDAGVNIKVELFSWQMFQWDCRHLISNA